MSKNKSGTAATKPDLSGLIDDREVLVEEDDRLSHHGLAQQLATLVLRVDMPANVALYGPWGSGKTGIANLLADQVDKDKNGPKGTRFVRFDAFKFSELPLRRNFISALANALDVKDDDFHEGLYREIVTQPPRRDLTALWYLLRIFLIALTLIGLAVVAFLTVVAGLVTFTGPPFKKTWALLMVTVAPAAVVVLSAATTAFFGAFVPSQREQRKVSPADSAEEFERIFEKLVERAKADRIVVFVDELDRCSPQDVVSTLDTIRTFLGVDKCVYVVAADRQVLEEALTDNLRQAAPSDAVNPYFSTGGAYLDKVFQYQLELPPLLQESLTKLAIDLAKANGGLWNTLRDLERTVSVLVPAHVRSPRRVKHLLNSYVVAHAVATDRIGNKLLDTDLTDREDELAKLVCMQVEYPLFAQDLPTDQRLPAMVLALYDEGYHVGKVEEQDDEIPDGSEGEDENKDDKVPFSDIIENDDWWERFGVVPADIRRIALRYAVGVSEVARLIDAPTTTAPEMRLVRQSQTRQLTEYLNRTRTITDPQRDLIYIRSMGGLFELEATVAERVEKAAIAANKVDLIESLQPGDRAKALELLTQRIRYTYGIEESNIARSMLWLAGDPEVSLPPRNDLMVMNIAGHLPATLNDADPVELVGAWRLGASGESQDAVNLRISVLHAAANADDPTALLAVLNDIELAMSADRRLLAETFVTRLLNAEPVQLGALLRALPTETIQTLFELSRERIASNVRSVIRNSSSDVDEADEAAVAAKKLAARQAKSALAILTSLLEHYGTEDTGAYRAVLTATLQINETRASNAVTALTLTPSESIDVARFALTSAGGYKAGWWAPLVRLVAPKLLAKGALTAEMAAAANLLWSRVVKAQVSDDAEKVLDDLRVFAGAIDSMPVDTRPDIGQVVTDSLSDVEIPAHGVAERQAVLGAAKSFVDTGLLDAEMLARIEMDHLTRAVVIDQGGAQQPGSEFVVYVEAEIGKLDNLDAAAASSVDDEDWSSLTKALAAAGSLPEPVRTHLALSVSAHLNDAGRSDLGLGTAAHLRAMADAFAVAADAAIGTWMRVYAPSAADIITVLRERLSNGGDLGEVLQSSLTAWADSATPADRAALSKLVLGAPIGQISDTLLSAIGVGRLPVPGLAAQLIECFGQVQNNGERQRVLGLWTLARGSKPDETELVVGILVPILEANRDGANPDSAVLGIDYLPQLTKPKGVARTPLLEAVKVAVATDGELNKRAFDSMKVLGYKSAGGKMPKIPFVGGSDNVADMT